MRKQTHFPFTTLLLSTWVVSGSKVEERVCLTEEVCSISWEGKKQREGFCVYMANLSQSHPDLQRVVVQNSFLKLLDLLMTNMDLYSITDAIP